MENPLQVQTLVTILQLFLTFGNVIIMLYAFSKFLSKPHDTLEARVTVLEAKQRDTEASLLQGNDRFKEQNNTNEVLLTSLLALIEFEIQYCLTEDKPISNDLERAKTELHSFLAKK